MKKFLKHTTFALLLALGATAWAQIGGGGISAGGGSAFISAKKLTDTSRTTTVSSADPDLNLTLGTGTYTFECYLSFTADATSGLKANLLVSQALATSSYSFYRMQAGTTAMISVVQNGGPTTVTGGGTRVDDATGNAGQLTWSGFLITPSSTIVSIQWGLQAGSTAAVLKAGSWCRAALL